MSPLPPVVLIGLVFALAAAAVFAVSAFRSVRRDQRRMKSIAYQYPPTLDRRD